MAPARWVVVTVNSRGQRFTHPRGFVTKRAAAAQLRQMHARGVTSARIEKRVRGDLVATPRAARRRKNPPMQAGVEQLASAGRGRGVLMSRHVLELRYYHALSRRRVPYLHDFGDGVHMYAMPDGSITLRHPTRRLWEDRVVGEDA